MRKQNFTTFGLIIDNKTSPYAEVLVRGQQITIFPKHAESHAIGMGLEDLIPSPEHITIHVVLDTMMTRKEKSFICQYAVISRGNCASIDRLWI